MDKTLKEHLALVGALSSTSDGKALLQLENSPKNNFAANMYLEALKTLAALRISGDVMAQRLRHYETYMIDNEAIAAWEQVTK